MTKQYKVEILLNVGDNVTMVKTIVEVENVLKAALLHYIEVDAERIKVIGAEQLLRYEVPKND